MSRLMMLSLGLLLWLGLLTVSSHQGTACLPSEIKPTDVVSVQFIKSGVDGNAVKKITVKQKLEELKAHCQNGKLVDAKGKEIYFYRLTGCWGNPPVDYLEILEQQRQEIEKLKERYTVIEMTCNPSGVPIP